MDEEFRKELIQTFILEFEELLDLYKRSLIDIKRNHEIEQAYADIFRIYHTFKGDASYFPEFNEFAQFTSHYCELLRPLDSGVFNNSQLLKEISRNYTLLRKTLNVLRQRQSLQSMQFDLSALSSNGET